MDWMVDRLHSETHSSLLEDKLPCWCDEGRVLGRGGDNPSEGHHPPDGPGLYAVWHQINENTRFKRVAQQQRPV